MKSSSNIPRADGKQRLDPAHTEPLAVVTGASRGIGFEIARELGKRGYDLRIVAEDDMVHEAAERLRDSGAKVEALQADLRDPQHVEHRRLAEPLAKSDAAEAGGDQHPAA